MKLADQLTDLLKIADSVNHSAHMEESFGYCVELAKDMFSCPGIAVILLDEQTEDLFIRTARGLSYTFLKEFRRPMGKDVMAEIIRTQHPILINDINPDSKFYSDLKLEHDFSSVVLAPITFDQHSAGIIYGCSPEKNHFQSEDRTIFAILGHLMGFAINKERLQTLNRRLAILDEKAKILTYTHFRDRLQYEILRAKEFTHPLSIMLFDIDHYKTYREIHGEKAGEELYLKIIRIIREELEDIDLIGRHGVDEIIVCKSQCSSSQAKEIANRIIRNVAKDKFEKDHKITLSAGVASLSNRMGDLVKLMFAVRTALLQAQRAGRNQMSLAVD